MHRLARAWALAVLLGGATLTLAACAGGSVRTVYVTVAPAVVESEAPSTGSATALTDDELIASIPKEARVEDFFGATAFAKFFMVEYRRMVSAGDSSLFEAMSSPGCTFCANALGERDEALAAGGSIVGGEIAVEEDFAGGGEVGDGTWSVTFGVSVARAQLLDADGAVSKTIPATADRVNVSLRFERGHWVVLDVVSD